LFVDGSKIAGMLQSKIPGIKRSVSKYWRKPKEIEEALAEAEALDAAEAGQSSLVEV